MRIEWKIKHENAVFDIERKLCEISSEIRVIIYNNNFHFI